MLEEQNSPLMCHTVGANHQLSNAKRGGRWGGHLGVTPSND